LGYNWATVFVGDINKRTWFRNGKYMKRGGAVSLHVCKKADNTIRNILTDMLFDFQFLVQGELIVLTKHVMLLLFIVIIY
jgi:hypothetical protein